jgi:predicted RND superfamily exporter protein
MQVTPSLLGLVASGLLTLFAVLYVVMNYKTLSSPDMAMVLLLLAIAVGIHSLLHYFQERRGFNPLAMVVATKEETGCPCDCAKGTGVACSCGLKCPCQTHRPLL